MENIYITYKDHEFKPLEFVHFAHKYQSFFTDYCEIVIDIRGHIYLASPSHVEKLISIAIQQFGFDDDVAGRYLIPDYIVSKYGYCLVWYDRLIVPGMVQEKRKYMRCELSQSQYDYIFATKLQLNKFQVRTLSILRSAGLIAYNQGIKFADEYQVYLYDQILMNEQE